MILLLRMIVIKLFLRYSPGRSLSKIIVNKTWIERRDSVVRDVSDHGPYSWFREQGVAFASPHPSAVVAQYPAQDVLLPPEGRRIKLRVSAKGIKVIDRDGIEAVVARLRRDGQRI
jgi:hypothetical protein